MGLVQWSRCLFDSCIYGGDIDACGSYHTLNDLEKLIPLTKWSH
jgi:hypothetical protein